MESVELTREELFEQVWKTPMSKLAAQYGVSDVALAKICKRLNIPRPGRGHWARLAAGEKLKRPPLPKGTPNQSKTIVLRRIENPPPKAPRVAPPDVQVPQALRAVHPVVREVGLALADAKQDSFGRMVIAGEKRPVFAVTHAAHRRALLILDALCKAIVDRGHSITYDVASLGNAKLALIVAGETMNISIVERLDRRDHAPTPEEKERRERGFSYGIPKYDQFASGELELALVDTLLARSSWSDGRKRRLEQWLGHVVMAVDAEVEARRNYREAQERRVHEEERRRQAEELQRNVLREQKARAEHLEYLVKDLRQMSGNWRAAQEIRDFLAAVRRSLAHSAHDVALVEWLRWAETIAVQLDPLCRPEELAKPLCPVFQAAT